MAKAENEKKAKKTSLLKMDVDLKNLSLSGKGDGIPTKDTMNLYNKLTTDNSPERVIPTAIIIAIIVILFCKFGVIDRLVKLNHAEDQLLTSQMQYEEYQKDLRDFPQVKERYYRYTDEYKTEEEAALINRAKIIDLMNTAASGYGQMKSFKVTGNEVSAEVYASNLDKVSKIRQRLEWDKSVSNVAVYTAKKSNGENTFVSASFVFDVVDKNAQNGGEE